MLNACVLSVAPFLVVVLDLFLVFFFLLMAVRSSAALRWRLGVFSLVFILTLPIDIARLAGSSAGWLGTANALWTCTAAYGLVVLVGISWKLGAPYWLGTLALTGMLCASGVETDIVNSVANGILAATGVVVMGWMYLRTRGFGSGNLTALWLVFLLHGSSYHLMARGGTLPLAYGFALVVLILWCQAIFGYAHLPRELEGRIPVQLPLFYPIAVMSIGGGLDLAFIAVASGWVCPPDSVWLGVLALGAACGVVVPLGVAFVRHRLYLIAYADEIEERLTERTALTRMQKAMLKDQNQELSRLNRRLKSRIEEQMAELVRSGELRHFLPTSVGERIIQGALTADRHFERQVITVLFCDLVGYTEMTSRHTPAQMAELLNAYMAEMSAVVVEHGGLVDKFVGDAVMAFFAPPRLDGHEQIRSAIRAALRMEEQMGVLEKEWSSRGFEGGLKARIGIHTGEATVGVFGSDLLRSYTAVGNPVNLAARLQTEANPGDIVCSHNTIEPVQDWVQAEDRGHVRLKGIPQPVRIFVVTGVSE
jgi:class 3 adenylate cyclase